MKKANNFLAVLTFCTLVSALSILAIGVLVEGNNMFTKLFALFFVIGAVSFLGYLKTLEK